MHVKDKMWHVQQPGTLLRARHSARYGQLALVLEKSHVKRIPTNGYPPTRWVKMQLVSTGEQIEESLTNANNCWDIVGTSSDN
jgi:hypothetical protein